MFFSVDTGTHSTHDGVSWNALQQHNSKLTSGWCFQPVISIETCAYGVRPQHAPGIAKYSGGAGQVTADEQVVPDERSKPHSGVRSKHTNNIFVHGMIQCFSTVFSG